LRLEQRLDFVELPLQNLAALPDVLFLLFRVLLDVGIDVRVQPFGRFLGPVGHEKGRNEVGVLDGFHPETSRELRRDRVDALAGVARILRLQQFGEGAAQARGVELLLLGLEVLVERPVVGVLRTQVGARVREERRRIDLQLSPGLVSQFLEIVEASPAHSASAVIPSTTHRPFRTAARKNRRSRFGDDSLILSENPRPTMI